MHVVREYLRVQDQSNSTPRVHLTRPRHDVLQAAEPAGRLGADEAARGETGAGLLRVARVLHQSSTHIVAVRVSPSARTVRVLY